MLSYHTGSQEESPVAVQEEQTGNDPQEIQPQEVLEEEERGLARVHGSLA
jgi:hypothetical protein